MWELRRRSSHIGEPVGIRRSHIPPVFLLHLLFLLLLLIHGGEKGSFHLRIVILKGCNLCQRDFLFRVDRTVCPRVKLLLPPSRPSDASPILTFKAHLLLLLLLLLLDGVLVRSLKHKVVRCQELVSSLSIAVVSVHIKVRRCHCTGSTKRTYTRSDMAGTRGLLKTCLLLRNLSLIKPFQIAVDKTYSRKLIF